MNRRLSTALSSLAAVALAAALAVTSRAAAHHAATAADPFTDPPHATAASPTSPPPCLRGPGAAAASLATHVDLPSLPDLARRAFTLERLSERAGSAPAFPQRMGLSAPPPC
jgi:hypothetical protein